MSDYLPIKLTDSMNIIVEFNMVDEAIYFHAEYDCGERSSEGYSSDLLDMVYSYGNFDSELEAIPVVAEMWQEVTEWIQTK